MIGLLGTGVGASIYEKRQKFKLLDLDNDGFLTKVPPSLPCCTNVLTNLLLQEELEKSGLDVEEVK